MSDQETTHQESGPPYEITVGLDGDDLVTFDPPRLQVRERGAYRITFRLADSVPDKVTFTEPHIHFKDEENPPFEVVPLPSKDERSFVLAGLNREDGQVPERYRYQVVLGLGELSHKSPDPSIIHHGTDGGPIRR